MKLFLHYIKIIIFSFLSINSISSQIFLKRNATKVLIKENKSLISTNATLETSSPIELIISNGLYYNSNLPNLENNNGLFFTKGTGSILGMLFKYNSKHILFTAEPTIYNFNEYPISPPKKYNLFSVTNDVPLIEENKIDQTFFNNLGILVSFQKSLCW